MFVGKTEGKRQLEKPRHRWESNIRIDLREILLESMAWIYLAQDSEQWRAIVNTVMNIQVPQKTEIYCLPKRLLAYREELLPMELGS